MLNNAFVTVGIKDLWTQKAKSIDASAIKMTKSIGDLSKKFNSTAQNFDIFEKKLLNVNRSLEKTQKKFNELHKLSPINLSSLINENLSKEINEVDKLKRKLDSIDSRMNARRDPANKIREVDHLKKQQTGGNMLGGFVTAATGVGFLRSATRNATEFDTALYDINRQLGEDENIKDYVKFIEKYSLATGQSRIAVAQQTAELRKTLKAGEGLETIKDKIQLMTFATNQLEVDSVTSAKAVEIIGNSFNLSAKEMKAFFSQANQMEDFYGAMVTGGDLLEIVGRMPITLLKNMKLMSKESTLMLATFAKANTNLDASAVGYNLGKALEGGNKAKGGGIIAMAEKQGKTIEEYLFSIGEEFKKIESVAGQNNFIEMITGTNDMQAKDVFRSLLAEIGKVDKAKVSSFQLVQKQFEEGKISSIEYRKEMEKLNSAEKTFVARFIKTEQGLKDFNRTTQLLGDTHEATLGKISGAWGMVSGAFGNQVLFPALGILADGLERMTPFVTEFINNNPMFVGALALTAGALVTLKTASLFFAGAQFGTAITMLSKLLGIVTLLGTVGTGLGDLFKGTDNLGVRKLTQKVASIGSKDETPEQIATRIAQEKAAKDQGYKPTIQELQDKRAKMQKAYDDRPSPFQNILGSFGFGNNSSPKPMPLPTSGIQARPTQGSIDVRIITDDKTQAITEVKKEDGTFLNILQPTKTRN